MTTKELQAGTIAVIHGKAVFVTSINTSATKNKIIIKKNIGSTEYCAAPADFTDVIGTFDVEKFKAGTMKYGYEVKKKSPTTESELISNLSKTKEDNSMSDLLPGNLKGCKVGDTVNLTNGKTAIFQGYKPNRPKNPVAITINGKPYKCIGSTVNN